MPAADQASTSKEESKSLATVWTMAESEDISHDTHNFKEFWIEKVFKRRECCRPLICRGDSKCGCGRLIVDHSYATDPASGILAVDTGEEGRKGQQHKWHPNKNTCTLPTDAFGQIEFQGVAHPNKAQYVRLDYATPPEHVLELLLNHWKLQLPRLLISVHGGIANFDLQPKLKRVFRKGLIRAANTTGAWIITGGTSTGVMKHVGEALSERTAKSYRKKKIVAIGVSPWGVVSERGDLMVKDECVEYHASTYSKSNMAVLNSSHNYFLLADNGSHGKYGAEIVLRKQLEHYVSQQKISSRGEKPVKGVPIVCMVLEGGSNTIRTVLDYITDTPAVPVVVCDGSGRASDLLAFAHKYCNEDGCLPDALKDQLVCTIQKTFAYLPEQASALYEELVLCMKKKEMITVFRMGEQVQDIDLAILTALLKSHDMGAPQQLSLALAWDRVDLARSHIFTYGQEWPEGSLEQAMMDALIRDRVDFVQLLLDKGVNMHRFLTVARLEELYNTKVGQTTTLYMVLRDVRKSKPLGAHVTLLEVGQIMNKLMGGAYRSSYSRRKFKNVYHEIMRLACSPFAFLTNYDNPSSYHTFEYPFNELMVWAVLLKRQAMAKFMWQREEEALAKAIIASKLYKSLYKEALEDALVDNVIAVELMSHSREFQMLALNFFDYVYKQDNDMAQRLLTYELKNWSGQTCLSLAYGCGMREFIAHTCCQNLITDMWMGGLRMNKNHNVKVFFGIILPVLIPMLGYKSQSELQLMPQTVEEHIQDLERTRESIQDATERSSSSRHGSVSGDSQSALSEGQLEEEETYEDAEAPNIVTWQPVNSMTPNVSSPAFALDRCIGISHANNITEGSANHAAPVPRKKRINRELRLSTKIYEFYSAPVTKFWLHTIAYFFFLGTLSYTVLVKLDRTLIHWTEAYTMAYIFFHASEMFREIAIAEPPKLSQKLAVFFEEKWNIIDAVAIPVFITGAVLRFQQDETIFLWGHVLYSLDAICWYVRILELFQVSRQLGPFVVIIEKLVNNILNMVAFFCIVIWAFGVPRQAILNPYAEPEWTLAKDVVEEPYFMFFGELFTEELNTPCGEGTDVICWPGRWLVPLLMSVYLLASYVLLMNLLIAVFNYTFMKLNSKSMEIWMYQRYRLMLEYEIKPLLPPPFVAVSHAYLVFKRLRRRLRSKPNIKDFGLKLFLNDTDIRKLHDFEEDCLGDFLLNTEMKHESSSDERIRVTSEKVDSVMTKVDDVNQKQGQLKVSFAALELRSSTLEALAMQANSMLAEIQEALLLPHVIKTKVLQTCHAGEGNMCSRSVSVDEETYLDEQDLPAAQEQLQNDSSRSTICKPGQQWHGAAAASISRAGPRTGCLSTTAVSARTQRTAAEGAEGSSEPVHFLIGGDDTLNLIGTAATPDPAPARNGTDAESSLYPSAVAAGGQHLTCTRPLEIPRSAMQQTEYTSITDAIDTSCLHCASPAHSPVLSKKRRLLSGAGGKSHRVSGTKGVNDVQPDQESLRMAEESATKVIGGSLRLRLRGLSLNESTDSLDGCVTTADRKSCRESDII